MTGQLNNGTDGKGMLYKVKLQVQANGGQVIAANNSLQIKNANSAIIYISGGTNYKTPAYAATVDKLLANALTEKLCATKGNAYKKYQQLFQRASVTLEGNNKDDLPTDKRLEAFSDRLNR